MPKPNYITRSAAFKRSFLLPPLIADNVNDLIIDFLTQQRQSDRLDIEQLQQQTLGEAAAQPQSGSSNSTNSLKTQGQQQSSSQSDQILRTIEDLYNAGLDITKVNDATKRDADAALRAGVQLFQEQKFDRAVRPLAIYYELSRRLPEQSLYLPGVADALLTRSLCYSLLKDVVQALHSVDLALHAVPYSPPALFWKGYLLLKSASLEVPKEKDGKDSATHLLATDPDRIQQAYRVLAILLRQNPEWFNLVELTLAIFCHVHGYFDKAIALCSRVIVRADDELTKFAKERQKKLELETEDKVRKREEKEKLEARKAAEEAQAKAREKRSLSPEKGTYVVNSINNLIPASPDLRGKAQAISSSTKDKISESKSAAANENANDEIPLRWESLNTSEETQKRTKAQLVRGLAYLVRGDSYKFHTGGYYCLRSADDYTVLLASAPQTFRGLIGKGFSVKHMENIDRLFLTLNVLGDLKMDEKKFSNHKSPMYSGLMPINKRSSGLSSSNSQIGFNQSGRSSLMSNINHTLSFPLSAAQYPGPGTQTTNIFPSSVGGLFPMSSYDTMPQFGAPPGKLDQEKLSKISSDNLQITHLSGHHFALPRVDYYPLFHFKYRALRILSIIGRAILFVGKLKYRVRKGKTEAKNNLLEQHAGDAEVRFKQRRQQIAEEIVKEGDKFVKWSNYKEMWGPVDINLCHVEPYRRPWMENPPKIKEAGLKITKGGKKVWLSGNKGSSESGGAGNSNSNSKTCYRSRSNRSMTTSKQNQNTTNKSDHGRNGSRSRSRTPTSRTKNPNIKSQQTSNSNKSTMIMQPGPGSQSITAPTNTITDPGSPLSNPYQMQQNQMKSPEFGNNDLNLESPLASCSNNEQSPGSPPGAKFTTTVTTSRSRSATPNKSAANRSNQGRRGRHIKSQSQQQTQNNYSGTGDGRKIDPDDLLTGYQQSNSPNKKTSSKQEDNLNNSRSRSPETATTNNQARLKFRPKGLYKYPSVLEEYDIPHPGSVQDRMLKKKIASYFAGGSVGESQSFEDKVYLDIFRKRAEMERNGRKFQVRSITPVTKNRGGTKGPGASSKNSKSPGPTNNRDPSATSTRSPDTVATESGTDKEAQGNQQQRPQAPQNTGKSPAMRIGHCEDQNYVTRDTTIQDNSFIQKIDGLNNGPDFDKYGDERGLGSPGSPSRTRTFDYGGGPVKTTAQLVRQCFHYQGDLKKGWSQKLLNAAKGAGSDNIDSTSISETVLRMMGLGYDDAAGVGRRSMLGHPQFPMELLSSNQNQIQNQNQTIGGANSTASSNQTQLQTGGSFADKVLNSTVQNNNSTLQCQNQNQMNQTNLTQNSTTDDVNAYGTPRSQQNFAQNHPSSSVAGTIVTGQENPVSTAQSLVPSAGELAAKLSGPGTGVTQSQQQSQLQQSQQSGSKRPAQVPEVKLGEVLPPEMLQQAGRDFAALAAAQDSAADGNNTSNTVDVQSKEKPTDRSSQISRAVGSGQNQNVTTTQTVLGDSNIVVNTNLPGSPRGQSSTTPSVSQTQAVPSSPTVTITPNSKSTTTVKAPAAATINPPPPMQLFGLHEQYQRILPKDLQLFDLNFKAPPEEELMKTLRSHENPTTKAAYLEALDAAKARSSAQKKMPTPTGVGWTDQQWSDMAEKKALEYVMQEETREDKKLAEKGLQSPVVSPRENSGGVNKNSNTSAGGASGSGSNTKQGTVTAAANNAPKSPRRNAYDACNHLKNRAKWCGRDVIDRLLSTLTTGSTGQSSSQTQSSSSSNTAITKSDKSSTSEKFLKEFELITTSFYTPLDRITELTDMKSVGEGEFDYVDARDETTITALVPKAPVALSSAQQSPIKSSGNLVVKTFDQPGPPPLRPKRVFNTNWVPLLNQKLPPGELARIHHEGKSVNQPGSVGFTAMMGSQSLSLVRRGSNANSPSIALGSSKVKNNNIGSKSGSGGGGGGGGSSSKTSEVPKLPKIGN